MVIGGAAAVAGAASAGAVKGLWGYNRENFLYDRKQRQEQELKVAEWRIWQAGLWREDVRDLIGLTERKMDSYLIVNTLQLGMCVALFTEGRLRPGTPHWLLHFYMLTLSAAFLYLLMSVWLAMHASVAAACESARLLTQMVRLPVPSWEQLESMRTYAASFERMGERIARIPFIDHLLPSSSSLRGMAASALGRHQEEPPAAGAASSSSVDGTCPPKAASEAADPSIAAAGGMQNDGVPLEAHAAEARLDKEDWASSGYQEAPDTWGVEGAGHDIYELQRRPLVTNRHIQLLRHAASHYQCHDAFARVSMSFGTNQLLFAITYYCIGYVSSSDGAPWPAGMIAAIMVGIAIALIKLDFQFSGHQEQRMLVLIMMGPVCSSFAGLAWSLASWSSDAWMMVLLPIACVGHGLWLLWALHSCAVARHAGGEMLPTRFRTVQYLDVFGWLHRPPHRAKPDGEPDTSAGGYIAMPQDEEDLYRPTGPPVHEATQSDAIAAEVEQLSGSLHSVFAQWSEAHERGRMAEPTWAQVAALRGRFHTIMQLEDPADAGTPNADPKGSPTMSDSGRQWQKMLHYTDTGAAMPYLFDPQTGRVKHGCSSRDSEQASSPGGGKEESPAHSVEAAELNRVAEMLEWLEMLQRSGAPQGAEAASSQPPLPVLEGEPRKMPICGEGGVTWARDMEAQAKDSMPWLWDQAGEEQEEALPVGQRTGSKSSTQEGTVKVDGNAPPPGEVETNMLVPWRVFRAATLMLVAIWFVSPLLVYGVFGGITEFGPHKRSSEAEGTGLPEFFGGDRMATFPDGGRLLDVEWPRQSAFMPQALSCDESGTRFVIADDFGVYTATRPPEEVDGSKPHRRLRNGTAALAANTSADGHHGARVRFTRVPPCTALEGEALKDLGVVCSRDNHSACRVLVLHANGKNLTECPLQAQRDAAGAANKSASAAPRDSRKVVMVQPAVSWTISRDWMDMDKEEGIESVAINNECGNASTSSGRVFDPDEVGCVVIGTTAGRVVQLRRHLTQETNLVPEWGMQQWHEKVGQGSLHVFPGGFVVTLRTGGSVQALDSRHGDVIGEWRLPTIPNIEWLTLCGGGNSIYTLGRDHKGANQLWQFPLPAELQGRLQQVRPAPPAQH